MNTPAQYQAFTRILNPGHSSENGRLFVKVCHNDKGRLSITGVEGPMSNGDAKGSCGQCVDALGRITTLSAGWTPEMVAKLRDVWEAWHLNDMRAGCEHQRAEGWGDEELEVVTYGLTSEAHELRHIAEAEACAAARDGRVAKLTPAAKFLIGPDWFKDRFEAPDADSPLSGLFKVRKRETKRANWVGQNEHPRGVLMKPCPVCGYKYGSAWLFEPVPEDVLLWLSALPETTVTPAWV